MDTYVSAGQMVEEFFWGTKETSAAFMAICIVQCPVSFEAETTLLLQREHLARMVGTTQRHASLESHSSLQSTLSSGVPAQRRPLQTALIGLSCSGPTTQPRKWTQFLIW